MIEWLENLDQYIYDLSVSIEQLFNEINEAIYSLNLFVQVGTYYIIGSGIVLAIILLVVIINQVKISRLQKKIDLLLEDRGIKQNE
jgi:hypothetical protein